MAEKKQFPRVERVEGEERKKALSAALAQIEKQFGKGSIMRMGDKGMNEDIDVVSTGSLGLDLALGVGGVKWQSLYLFYYMGTVVVAAVGDERTHIGNL